MSDEIDAGRAGGTSAPLWQVDLVQKLGYTPNPVTTLWDIAQDGVEILGDRVVVTEVIVDERGLGVFTPDGQRVDRRVWHDLPVGWKR